MTRAAFLACAGLLIGAASPSPVSPEALRAQIARTGPKATVDALAGGQGRAWDAVLRHVSRGEPAWLALAPELRRGADAGTAEGLEGALSDALAVAPERVLALTPRGVPMERLCTSPLIEATPAQQARWRRPRLAALRHVRAPALRDEARECARLIAR